MYLEAIIFLILFLPRLSIGRSRNRCISFLFTGLLLSASPESHRQALPWDGQSGGCPGRDALKELEIHFVAAILHDVQGASQRALPLFQGQVSRLILRGGEAEEPPPPANRKRVQQAQLTFDVARLRCDLAARDLQISRVILQIKSSFLQDFYRYFFFILFPFEAFCFTSCIPGSLRSRAKSQAEHPSESGYRR